MRQILDLEEIVPKFIVDDDAVSVDEDGIRTFRHVKVVEFGMVSLGEVQNFKEFWECGGKAFVRPDDDATRHEAAGELSTLRCALQGCFRLDEYPAKMHASAALVSLVYKFYGFSRRF